MNTCTSNGCWLGALCTAELPIKLANRKLVRAAAPNQGTVPLDDKPGSDAMAQQCSEPQPGLRVKLDHKQSLWAALPAHKLGSSTDCRAKSCAFGWTSHLAPTCPPVALLMSSITAPHATSSLSETPGQPADAPRHHLCHPDRQHCL